MRLGLKKGLVTIISLTSLASLFISNTPTVDAQTAGTRCTTTGETLFLRFNYVPVQGEGYLENKAIIYVPKEAQCAGSFPMYVHLHGDNKYTDDISPFYLPSAVDGVRQTAHYPDNGVVREVVGSNKFQQAIEASMRNQRVPGMIFVLPVNASPHANWVNLDGAALKTAVQNALNTNSKTQGKGITLNSDTLLSGHSGAGCHTGEGLMGFPNLAPKAVGVIDTCPSLGTGTSVFQTVSTLHPNATLLFYGANMAYTNARFTNNVEQGGYHNLLNALGFVQQANCDSSTFFNPHNPTGNKSYGVSESSHFRQYWDNPQLWCSKSPSHPWYGLFATGVNHTDAAALGVRTLINLYYSQNTPTPSTGSTTTTNQQPASNTTGTNTTTTTTTTVNSVNAPVVAGSVPLEIDINGTSSIDGSNQGYIINYARTIFLYAAGLTGLLALLVLIVAGIQMIMTGSGEKNTQSVQLIVGSISGLALLATSGWILYLINPCFFSFANASACTPRGAQTSDFTYTQSATAPRPINNPAITLNGTPPPPPTPRCDANNVCDVVLPVRYISQIEAPDECSYDNICATNPTAGLQNGRFPKWGQVSCGATAYSVAYLYVSGNSTPARQFLSTFINDYFRCGLKGISPAARASIGGYEAVSAPRTDTDPLCAYELGGGGRPAVLKEIIRNVLGARGTHTVSDLTPAAIYQELSQGHPIVVGGMIKQRGSTRFVPEGHYTVLIGIRGYNAATAQFSDLVIHDVGRGPNLPLTFENYNELRAVQGDIRPLHSGVAVAM